MIDTSPASQSGLVSKFAPPPNQGYALVVSNADLPGFLVSGTGGASVSAFALATTIAVWHFIVGRYTPSTEVAIFVDGDKTVNVTAVPASCNVSTANFEVGRYEQNNSRVLHAKCRDVFICRTALSDELIEEVRQSSVP